MKAHLMHIRRKTDAVASAGNRAGTSVMLPSENTARERMMSPYDVRDRVEKAFDVCKNDPDGNGQRGKGRRASVHQVHRLDHEGPDPEHARGP
jgi:hypothetical protein